MTTTWNMSPGTSTRDIDPPCCPECDGAGVVENLDFGKPSYASEEPMMTCPWCSGLGVPNTRVRGESA